jgi:serine/threonine protein kinase
VNRTPDSTIERASSVGERVVESTIDPRDLTATREDKKLGRDWRSSRVSGEKNWVEGANGKVLRAVWKSSIAVAVKEGDWDEMTDEMNLFLDLTHPHVVACYGILNEMRTRLDKDGKQVEYLSKSIVTERCTVPLEAFLKDESQWQQDVFGSALNEGMVDMRKYTILHHVSLGLQKLHDLNVLHRDIKSGNILLDGAPGTCSSCKHSGLWKICDFGEAKVLKTPSLTFHQARPFPKGWSHQLVATHRFLPITSEVLRSKGARHCQ